jgi:hypothetical protein
MREFVPELIRPKSATATRAPSRANTHPPDSVSATGDQDRLAFGHSRHDHPIGQADHRNRLEKQLVHNGTIARLLPKDECFTEPGNISN